jgi:hypothetical protein
LSQDGSSAGLEVVIAPFQGLSESVCSVALETRGVLLEGTSPSSVSGSGRVDSKGTSLPTCIAGGSNDGSVTSNELGGGKEAENNEG